MSNIYVISDTHFCHNNVLNFTDDFGNKIRQFNNLNEMHDCIISNWNDTIKDSDIVYHLGDVFLGNREEFEFIWKQLKGKKRLIIGNHDDVKDIVKHGYFQKVYMWRMFEDYILTHVPIHKDSIVSNKTGKKRKNIHGHTHQRVINDSDYINVCVEVTNYKPIGIT